MRASDVHQYFRKNCFHGNFWNDIVVINGETFIPVSAIEKVLFNRDVDNMKLEVQVFINPEFEESFDLWKQLRSIGLTTDQCSGVCDIIDKYYEFKSSK